MRRWLVVLSALVGCYGEREPRLDAIVAAKRELVVIPGDRLVPRPEQASYRWRILDQPPAAATRLLEAESPRPSFETDTSGLYVIEARIQTGLNELSARVRIDVVNVPPAISAPGEVVVFAGDFGFLGLEVTNPDFDPLTFEVRTLAAPAGSAPLAEVDFGRFEFLPDLVGDYRFEVTVDDGEATATAIIEARALPPIRVLTRDPDGLFVYSRPLDTIAGLVDLSRNLLLYDVAADTVELPGTNDGRSLGLRPDGRSLAIGRSRDTRVVELESGEARAISTGGVTHIAYGSDSRLFFSGVDFNADDLSEYDLEGDQLFSGSGTFPVIHSIALAPNQPAIYVAHEGELAKWTTATSPPSVAATLAAETCDALWLADDGSVLIDGTGNVYGLSADPDQDLALRGNLENAAPPACFVRHADIASAARIAAIIRSDAPDRIWIYDLETRAVIQTIPLPEVPPDMPVELNASAVFLTADGSSYRLVLDHDGRLAFFAGPVPPP